MRCDARMKEARIDVMSRWCHRWLVLTLVALSVGGCRVRDSGRVDSLALRQDAAGPRLRIAIIGRTDDPRISAAREAVDYSNAEFARLGRRFRLDAPVVRTDSIPDEMLRAASGEAVLGIGPATWKLRRTLSAVPADIVIALSQTDLISFGVRWRPGQLGAVAIRRADVWPLSLPNTVRNVIAHELGHVLGLEHNGDATTLMCGRPASCRPVDFASGTARFFPLTAEDERRLTRRWP